jgi:hypothetical protein
MIQCGKRRYRQDIVWIVMLSTAGLATAVQECEFDGARELIKSNQPNGLVSSYCRCSCTATTRAAAATDEV